MAGFIDKRYQVFISSTYEDLHVERQEVMQALLELDCMPAGMELFPAANDDQWTLIKRVIDDCDYYIVIIGGRYGSIAPSGLSYTQMEYDYALLQGKPVIAFLHKEPGKIQADRTERTAQGARKGWKRFANWRNRKCASFGLRQLIWARSSAEVWSNLSRRIRLWDGSRPISYRPRTRP